MTNLYERMLPDVTKYEIQIHLKRLIVMNFRQGSVSGESSSTVSQTSYDPSKPSFRGMDSEIPASDTVSVDTTGTGETQGSGSSAGAAGTTFTKKSKGRDTYVFSDALILKVVFFPSFFRKVFMETAENWSI